MWLKAMEALQKIDASFGASCDVRMMSYALRKSLCIVKLMLVIFSCRARRNRATAPSQFEK